MAKKKTAEELVRELKKANRQLTADLSKFQEQQRQIIQRERLHALGQMASGIVHDFNNALTPILGATDFMLMHPEVLQNKQEAILLLESARTAASDARDMVRRLREFYRLEEGVVAGAIDVNPIIEQVVLLTQPKWKKEALSRGAKISFETKLGAGLPWVRANDAYLREVLTNIILNSVDAMPEDGTISISTSQDKDDVVVKISDTGEGMSEEVRQRCFEPFYSTKGRDGTGMGLAMAYGVIRGYQGNIEIESEPGKGTAISVSLPSAPRVEEELIGVSPSRDAVSPMKVLVVDDNLLSCGIIEKYLQSDGHAVETAQDGSEGLRKCKAGSFDLIVLDGIMPGINGVTLADEMKKSGAGPCVILLTGSGDVTEDGECPKSVDSVVEKPVTHAGLRDAISEVVKMKG